MVRGEGIPQTDDAPFVRDIVLRIRLRFIQEPTIHKETILPLFSFLYASHRFSKVQQPWRSIENETMGGIMDGEENGLSVRFRIISSFYCMIVQRNKQNGSTGNDEGSRTRFLHAHNPLSPFRPPLHSSNPR